MTQFTSFVAVEELAVTLGGEPVTIAVPVDIPAGVSYEGVFGQQMAFASTRSQPMMALSPAPVASTPLGRFSKSPVSERPLGQLRQEVRDAAGERDPAAVVETKLAEPLCSLDQQLAKIGKDGNLTIGKLRVVDHHVDVTVYIRDTSPQIIDTLKQPGFIQTGESKAARLLIGSIDVRQLAGLAQLDPIIRITPVVD